MPLAAAFIAVDVGRLFVTWLRDCLVASSSATSGQKLSVWAGADVVLAEGPLAPAPSDDELLPDPQAAEMSSTVVTTVPLSSIRLPGRFTAALPAARP